MTGVQTCALPIFPPAAFHRPKGVSPGSHPGYVFGTAQQKTAAHELGHGIFKLEHPWKAYGTTQSATPLLMDYSTGEELSHLDWKQINDPAFKLYAFQSQSSGEDVATQFNYLMPNKTPFRFKNTDGKLAADVILVNTTNNGGNPNGTLYGFNVNGIEYAYKDGKFTSSSGVYENQYLDKNRNVEVKDTAFCYFLHIEDFLGKDKQKPLDFARDEIKEILINLKRVEFINKVKEDLYQRASDRNKIIYYYLNSDE